MVSPFNGNSRASKYIDYFVALHAFFAFSFATLSLFVPQAFSMFANESYNNQTIAADATRLSAPFIYGFSFFAIRSLFLDKRARVEMACIFAVCLLMASAVCIWVQVQGRWEVSFVWNTIVFAGIGSSYTFILLVFRDGFDRAQMGKKC